MKCGIVLSLALLASVANASDFERSPVEDGAPPLIEHIPVEHVPRGSEFVIRARITDPSGVIMATLNYRLAGVNAAWHGVELVPSESEAGDFVGVVAGSHFTGDLEYFIEAFDTFGNGPAMFGTREAPLRVRATEALHSPATDGLPIMPIAVTGTGVLMTAVGAVLWFTAAAQLDEIDAKYSDAGQGRLPADAEATRNARGRSLAGSVLMVAGGATVIGGLTWWLAPSSSGAPAMGVAGRF